MSHIYTDEEKKEVEERVLKAEQYLRENDLIPLAFASKVNLGIEGRDVFADQIQVYLKDIRYEEKEKVEPAIVSPIQKDDVDKKA